MSAARKLETTQTYLETGRVERVAATVAVRLGAVLVEAERAKSCLVAPEPGDKVLCAVEPEATYVLSVLASRSSAPTRLEADGDLELGAPRGRVVVRGREAVQLRSEGEIELAGPLLRVEARTGEVAIDELGFFGRLLRADVKVVKLLAHELDTVAERITARVRRVFRFVEEIDQTRAGMVDMRAESLLALRGENAVIAARVLAKVDGEQIHLG
jgi:hypothetical protein